jgi:hypothetical protein
MDLNNQKTRKGLLMGTLKMAPSLNCGPPLPPMIMFLAVWQEPRIGRIVGFQLKNVCKTSYNYVDDDFS